MPSNLTASCRRRQTAEHPWHRDARGLAAIFAAIAAALAGALPLTARADRPLVSETADVIERGACQVETAFGRIGARGQAAARDFSAVYTCGMAADTQPQLAYAQSRLGGERIESLLLGAKTTLKVPADGQVGFGLAYSAQGLKLPHESYHFDELRLVGLGTAEMGHGWLGHVNLGTSRSRSARQSTTVWSLGVETVGDLTFAADVFGDDRSRPAASAGVGYLFGAGVSANLAYAVQFDTPRVRQWSLGAKLAF